MDFFSPLAGKVRDNRAVTFGSKLIIGLMAGFDYSPALNLAFYSWCVFGWRGFEIFIFFCLSRLDAGCDWTGPETSEPWQKSTRCMFTLRFPLKLFHSFGFDTNVIKSWKTVIVV